MRGKKAGSSPARRKRTARQILDELCAAVKNLMDTREMELGFVEECGSDELLMSDKDRREYRYIKDCVRAYESNVRAIIREAMRKNRRG